MAGQTFRENIEQEVHYIIYSTDGDTEDLITELVDWVVGRFGPEVASAEYLESVGAELSEEYRPAYDALKAYHDKAT